MMLDFLLISFVFVAVVIVDDIEVVEAVVLPEFDPELEVPPVLDPVLEDPLLDCVVVIVLLLEVQLCHKPHVSCKGN